MTSLAERIAQLVRSIEAERLTRERIAEGLSAARLRHGERVVRDAEGQIIETRRPGEEN